MLPTSAKSQFCITKTLCSTAAQRYVLDVPLDVAGRLVFASPRCNPKWSPHSPDLNPLDFYLWGYLKDSVYEHNPQNIPDPKAAITKPIRAIPREEEGTLPGESKSACNAGGASGT